MSARRLWSFPLVLALGGSLAFILSVRADDDHHEGSRSSRLAPPEGAASPDALGQVRLRSDELRVQARGLPAGDYGVLLDDGSGTKIDIGKLTVQADDGDDEDGDEDGDVGDDEEHEGRHHDHGDEPEDPADAGDSVEGGQGGGEGHGPDGNGDSGHGDHSSGGNGTLRLSGEALPFGATSALDLGGRAICVVDAEGNVVLSGMTPSPIVKDPTPRSGRCPLSRPDPAVDEDAEGVLKLESGEGRLVVKVHLFNLEPGKIYDVVLTNLADPPASESLGMVTAGDGGNGQFKVDTARGDEAPFGVGDLAELVGYGVSVLDEAGAAVLVGAVCAPQVRPGHEDDDDDEGEADDGDDDDGEAGPGDDPAGDDPAGDDPAGDDGTVDDGAGDDPAAGDGTDPGADAGAGGAEEPLFLMVGEFDARFYRGDANNDTVIDIADPVSVLNFLFLGGARPYCLDAADANDDGQVDLADPINILQFLFLGGREPSTPGILIPGSDETADSLYCQESV